MSRSTLARLVLIALSFLAVTAALASVPGRAVGFWYLYYSPVVMAALSFGLVGSVVGSTLALASLLIFFLRVDAALRQASLALVQRLDASSSGFGRELGQRLGEWGYWGITPSGVPVEVNSVQDSLVQALIGITLITILACIVGWLVDQNRRRQRLFQAEARIDALTGVPNYRSLMELLESQIRECERSGRSFGYMMVDVDGMKALNDAHGHRVGNDILTEVSHRLRAGLSGQARMLARYGGDEFGAVFTYSAPAAISTVAHRLLKAVAEPAIMAVPGVPAQVTISIGVAVYPADGRTVDELVEAADGALYQSKLEGRNAVTFAGASHASEEQSEPG